MAKSRRERIGAAVFYGLSSFSITIINKYILTTYAFPSFLFLGLGQILTTILTIQIAKVSKIVTLNAFQPGEIFWKIFPLPLLYVGNMMFGLGSTKNLSLPMYNALRKLSTCMTMGFEFCILGLLPEKWVLVSVFVMIVGDAIAAFNDLGFNALGYFYVLGNDLFTALQYTYIKVKLTPDLNEFTMMYYNSLFILFPAALTTFFVGDLEDCLKFPHWSDPIFVLLFASSCFMGFLLVYSTIMCTNYNSPLTTTVIGSAKNIFTTYIGMFVGGDYIFSLVNFVGLNVSVLGTLGFTYVKFRAKREGKLAATYTPIKTEEI